MLHKKSLPADSTSSSPENSLALCLGVMDVGSALPDPVDFFFPSGGVLTWTFLFLANEDGAGTFKWSRILGGADPPLLEQEHPVELLLRVVSEENGYADGYTSELENSSNSQSFILPTWL